MDPIKVHPDSPFGKILLKMAEDKRLVNQYIREGKDLRELRAKGIKIGNPL
jgi:hypothetical protein